LKVMFNT